MWPVTARPTRQVSPTTVPLRLRRAEMRCRVPCEQSAASLLQPLNEPDVRWRPAALTAWHRLLYIGKHDHCLPS